MILLNSTECNAIRQLIFDWDGFNSETFFQKYLFFLESLNWKKIRLGYKKGEYGPFSNKAKLSLRELKRNNHIDMKKNGFNTSIKPNLYLASQISIKKNTNSLDDKLEYKVLEFLESIGNLKVIGWLSSFHFIIIHQNDFNLNLIFDEFYDWKKITNDDLQQYSTWNELMEFYKGIILFFFNEFHFIEVRSNFLEAIHSLHSKYSRKSPLAMMRTVLEGLTKCIIDHLKEKPKGFASNIHTLINYNILDNGNNYMKLYSKLSRYFSHYSEFDVNFINYFYQSIIAIFLLITKFHKYSY